MRILITQESDWLERNPLQQHHLAEMLSLRGHEILVIDYEILWRTHGRKQLASRREIFKNVCKIYSGAEVTVVRPGIVKIPLVDCLSLIISHRREIARQIEEFKPDITLGFGILNAWLAARAARSNGLPFVYHWLDVLHFLIPFTPLQPLGRIIESRTLRRSSRVIAVSEKMKESLVELGAEPERVVIVRSGISLEKFRPGTGGTMMRRRYGIGEEDIVLFFMGWLYHFSGLKEVALALTRPENSHLKFLIVGDGDAFKDLQRIREEHDLQNRLILTGTQPYEDIPSFIAASDVCLLPAYPDEKVMQDGLPAKLYEYMAMQKPVLATRLPGVMREFGQDNGVVYIDTPEEAVVRALELVRKGEVAEMGRRARRFVESYDWRKIADQYEQILTEAIEQKSEPVT